jgi:Pyrimidine dimer DNA glycosylase
MNTFLPYADFAASAQTLDRQRLGKQRVENLQIMKVLIHGGGWSNHPAVKMWRGYESGLMAYQLAIVTEWCDRGYQDTCLRKTWDMFVAWREPSNPKPHWLGDYDFHRSHQSNLVRKDPQHYGPLFPGVPPYLAYVWPEGANDEYRP